MLWLCLLASSVLNGVHGFDMKCQQVIQSLLTPKITGCLVQDFYEVAYTQDFGAQVNLGIPLAPMPYFNPYYHTDANLPLPSIAELVRDGYSMVWVFPASKACGGLPAVCGATPSCFDASPLQSDRIARSQVMQLFKQAASLPAQHLELYCSADAMACPGETQTESFDYKHCTGVVVIQDTPFPGVSGTSVAPPTPSPAAVTAVPNTSGGGGPVAPDETATPSTPLPAGRTYVPAPPPTDAPIAVPTGVTPIADAPQLRLGDGSKVVLEQRSLGAGGKVYVNVVGNAQFDGTAMNTSVDVQLSEMYKGRLGDADFARAQEMFLQYTRITGALLPSVEGVKEMEISLAVDDSFLNFACAFGLYIPDTDSTANNSLPSLLHLTLTVSKQSLIPDNGATIPTDGHYSLPFQVILSEAVVFYRGLYPEGRSNFLVGENPIFEVRLCGDYFNAESPEAGFLGLNLMPLFRVGSEPEGVVMKSGLSEEGVALERSSSSAYNRDGAVLEGASYDILKITLTAPKFNEDKMGDNFSMLFSLRGDVDGFPAWQFASGKLPQTSSSGDMSGTSLHIRMQTTCLPGDPCDCPHHCWRCVGEHGECICAPGWTGELCDEQSSLMIATSLTGGAAIASTSLDVMLAQSFLTPVHTLTTLQLLYFIGKMECTKGDSKDATAGLALTVRPFSWDFSTSETFNVMATMVVLQIAFVVLHVTVVACVFIATNKNVRSWAAAAAKVGFPNVSFVVMVILCIPTQGSLVNQEEMFSMVPVVGVMATVGVVGMIVFLTWFARNCISGDAAVRNAEFLEFNLGNTSCNARLALSSQGGSMMRLFRIFLPKGYWSSRHIQNRGFMHSYALVFHEYLPSTAVWFPLLSYIRLPFLAYLTYEGRSGCKARGVVILVFSVLHCAVWLYTSPLKSIGANVTFAFSYVVFILLVAAFFWVAPAVPLLVMLLLVAMIFFSIWQTITVIYTRIKQPKRKSFATKEEYEDDLQSPPRAIDEAKVLEISSKKSGEDVINLARSGTTKYCEVHSMVIAVFSSRSSHGAECVIPFGECEVEFTGGGFIFKNYKPRKNLVLLPSSPEKAARLWTLLSEIKMGATRLVPTNAAPLTTQDRTEYYTLSEEDAIPTSTGRYIPCVKNGSRPRDSPSMAFRMQGSARLLMHEVNRGQLSAVQQKVLHAELSVLSRLRNDFLLSAENPFETTSHIKWVVKYAHLGNLAHHITTSGKMDEATAAFFFAEALLGMEHLHANNIIFRNFSPTDILFERGGHVVLSCPGVPHPVSEEKWGYVAPEVLSLNDPTEKSDVFSLGCVLYFMTHGVAPFNGSTAEIVKRMVLAKSPHIQDVGSELREVLSSCLQKDPKARRVVSNVKTFAWFSSRGADFTAISRRTVSPPLLGAAPRLCDSVVYAEETTNPLLVLFESKSSASSRKDRGETTTDTEDAQKGTKALLEPSEGNSTPISGSKVSSTLSVASSAPLSPRGANVPCDASLGGTTLSCAGSAVEKEEEKEKELDTPPLKLSGVNAKGGLE